jgi:hypothetical protein
MGFVPFGRNGTSHVALHLSHVVLNICFSSEENRRESMRESGPPNFRGPMSPSFLKQLLQNTSRPALGRNGTWHALPHWLHVAS